MFLGSKIGFICQVRIVQPIDIVINEKIDIDRILVVTFTSAAASEIRENNHDTGKHTYCDTRIEQRYFTSYLHYDSPFNEIP